jgi:hypothetical protein
VRQAGKPDRETLRRRAAHAGPIEEGTLVYRIEFHVVGTGWRAPPGCGVPVGEIDGNRREENPPRTERRPERRTGPGGQVARR